MKKLTARVFTPILLAFGLLFGGAIAPAVVHNPLLTPVYADEDDETDNNTNNADNTNSSNPDAQNPNNETPVDGDVDPDNAGNNTDSQDNQDSPDSTEGASEDTSEDTESSETVNTCQDQTGHLAWFVCPSSGVGANIVDTLYAAISDVLIVQPISMASDSPVYLVWQYARNLTNIIFIIFLLIVIYSQLTSLGLSNYGIKRVLPRLIIAVLLVNLSFIICSLAVDVSNIIGSSLREFFTSIQETIIANSTATAALSEFSFSSILTAIISGATIIGVAAGAVGGAGYLFFMFLIVLIGAIISIVTGLLTIAARQALVALLIMISPLAFVSYLLPNTEKWFTKWKELLFRMLIFYPMFSFLFGASQLVGYALMISANSDFGIILGLAVQVFPLFFSWSLMKMSGTILGTLNAGLNRLAAPINKGAAGWALSNAEQHRQNHLANSAAPGAKLRRYLDYRRKLREVDTANSATIREGKAIEATMRTASSSLGRDSDGNPRYRKRANRYTANAKRASIYGTRATTAQSAYRNTLSSYGRHFSHSDHDAAHLLSDFSNETYKEAKAQEYLTANEAEADQTYLLDEYLAAINNRDSYEFNRLIKGAAGSLGYKGEASIMGQVIAGNSAIENRRRAEARIMITKFGVNKPEFRAMILDQYRINDNGIALDADGNEIEDDQYNLLPGKTRKRWNQYIGVHKKTGQEITRDQYDGLSDTAKDQYRRVRYMDIIDKSNGKPVQRVYFDDAGYMKEMLADDVAIGDPINKRYFTEIGAKTQDDGSIQTGMLYKYHSTISGAMNSTKYKDHWGAATPMLNSQANNGFIGNIGELNIGNLQSFNVSSKPGPILQNDAIFIKDWAAMLNTVDNPEQFAHFFPDESIMTYQNVNGEKLKGFRLKTDEETGEQSWEEIGQREMKELERTNPAEALRLRKNYIKHNILPKAARKFISITNRRISPNILEQQKGDTLEALKALVTTLGTLGTKNLDPNIPFDQKLDGKDLFTSDDPSVLQYLIKDIQAAIARQEAGEAGNDTPASGAASAPGQRSHAAATGDVDMTFVSNSLRQVAEMLGRYNAHQAATTAAHDTGLLIDTVSSFVGDNTTELYSAIDAITNLVLNQIEPGSALYDGIDEIIRRYQSEMPPSTTEESLARKDALCEEVRNYLETYGYDD